MNSGQPFRFAVISDLHFGEVANRWNRVEHRKQRLDFKTLPSTFHADISRYNKVTVHQSTHDPTLAHGVAEALRARASSLDALVICGDMAPTGREQDLDAAFKYIYDSPVHSNIFLIPGNHDRLDQNTLWGQALSRRVDPRHRWQPGGVVFDSVFKLAWPHGRDQIGRLLHPKDKPEFCILGADFCLTSAGEATSLSGALGQGYVYPTRLQNLQTATTDVRAAYPGCVVIWLVHFAPLNNCIEELYLLQADELTAAAQAQNIPLMISGHLHEKDFAAKDGCAYFTAASCMAVGAEKGHWIHFFQLERKTGQGKRTGDAVEARIWNACWDWKEGLFVPLDVNWFTMVAA